MKEQGHEVQFLVPVVREMRTGIGIFDTGMGIPGRIKRKGIAVRLMPPRLLLILRSMLLPFKSGYSETAWAFGMFFQGLERDAWHILQEIDRFRPDVLVADFAFPAASIAADFAKIPYALLYHSGLPFRGDGIPPFGSGLPIGYGKTTGPMTKYLRRENRLLPRLDRRVNTARRAFGLPPMQPDILRRPYSPWLNLIPSAEIMEAPRNNLSSCTYFIGPCLGNRAEPLELPAQALVPGKFKVFVSLGTVFNNKPAVFRKILRALDHPEYQVIVSAGGAYGKLSKEIISSNAIVLPSVSQVSLLPFIDLFISHGGNNSINEALASGKQILVLPVGGEQADNASRVVHLCVGKRIDISDFSELQLRGAVDEMRRTDSFRVRAETMMHGLREFDGCHTASRCIEWVAQHRRPLEAEGLSCNLSIEGLQRISGLQL
jgi:MGT family glycosyltransferase